MSGIVAAQCVNQEVRSRQGMKDCVSIRRSQSGKTNHLCVDKLLRPLDKLLSAWLGFLVQPLSPNHQAPSSHLVVDLLHLHPG